MLVLGLKFRRAHLAAYSPASALPPPATELAAVNGAAKPETDVLLTVKEAATKLKCSEKKLYRGRGKFPFFVNAPGRGLRISEKKLTKYSERRA